MGRTAQYRSPYHEVYRVRLEWPNATKELFVSDYGTRVGVVVEGAAGILLVRQYRYLIDNLSYEIPGGRVNEGERLRDSAIRECAEETGIVCRDLKPLIMFHPGLDTVHNPSHIFYGRKFRASQRRDNTEHERCETEWIPIRRCLSMINSGMIIDSLSIIGLFAYLRVVQ